MGWHTIRRAADILEVAENTIRNRIKAKSIPFRQVEQRGRLVYEVEVEGVDTTPEATPAMMDARESIASLRSRVDGLVAQLEHVQGERDEVQARLEARIKELGTAREAIAVLEAITGELRTQVDKEHDDVKEGRDQITELTVRIEGQSRDLQDARKEASEHRLAYEAVGHDDDSGGLAGRVRRAFRALVGQPMTNPSP